MNIETTSKPDTTPKGKATGKSVEAEPAARVLKPFARPQLTAHVSNHWTVFAPNDVRRSDLENPAMWQFAGKFAKHDTVQVIANDWWALCLVTDSGPGRTCVAVLMSSDVAPPSAVESSGIPEGYEIRVAEPGALARYAVIRLKDGRQLNVNERHLTPEDARRWLIDLATLLNNH